MKASNDSCEKGIIGLLLWLERLLGSEEEALSGSAMHACNPAAMSPAAAFSNVDSADGHGAKEVPLSSSPPIHLSCRPFLGSLDQA